MERSPGHVVPNHFKVDELEQGRGLDVCMSGSAGRVGGTSCSRPTHILTANFGAAFFQTVLDIFPLVALVVPQTSDEVVQRFLEPGRHHQHGGSRRTSGTAGRRTWRKVCRYITVYLSRASNAQSAASGPDARCSVLGRGAEILEPAFWRGLLAEGSVENNEMRCDKAHLAGGVREFRATGLLCRSWGDFCPSRDSVC